MLPKFHRSYIAAGWSLSLLLCLIGYALLPAAPHVQAATTATRIYVKANAPDGNSGATWETARSLKSALAAASAGDEIWVAAGLYLPGTSSADTFTLKSGVKVYGGFAGDETAREQRNTQINLTILSGDIDDNDTKDDDGITVEAAHINGTNARHVVSAIGVDASAQLDGFVVTAGSAPTTTETCPNDCGAGLLLDASSPTLANLLISGNNAGLYGGGLYMSNDSQPMLANVIFRSNLAVSGGGVTENNSNPTLVDVTFTNNRASYIGEFNPNRGVGGGMYIQAGSATLTNTAFINNVASLFGGGMSMTNSTVTLTTGEFIGNTASSGGGMLMSGGSQVRAIGITINGNQAAGGGGIYTENGSKLVLANTNVSGNRATIAGGGFNSHANTLLMLTNVTMSGNEAPSGSAFANANHVTLVVQNSIIWGNDAESIYNNPSAPFTTTFSHALVQGLNPPGDGNLDGTDESNAPRFVRPVNCGSTCGDIDDDYGDLRLQSGSPAIDAGTNTAPIDELTTVADLATDLAGQARIVAAKSPTATVDLGAYEAVATPPIANAGGPYTVDEGSPLALDASASTDDGGIATYTWDCTNNGSNDTTSSNPTGSTCTYPTRGIFTLKLAVTDYVGITDTATTTVTVVNVAPTFTAPPNQSTFARTVKTFSLGTFTDPGDNAPWQVTVEWGDETTDNSFQVSSTGSLTATHTYASVGSYSVIVTVNDGEASTQGGFQATINAVPSTESSIFLPNLQRH